MLNIDEPFFFDTDGDGHWYMVPARIREEWTIWRNLEEPRPDASDEEWDVYWSEPEEAMRAKMHPSDYVVRFVNE